MANQDVLGRFPDQSIENRPTECVGETVADLVGNIAKIPCDAGFSYAASLRIQGISSSITGSDPEAGMRSAILYGALPTSKQPFDATSTSEGYESDLSHFSPSDVYLASLMTQNGVVSLSSFNDIVDHLKRNIGGVSLTLSWYGSFTAANADGTLPAPSGTFTSHNVAVYDYDPAKGLLFKPWLGASYGVNGYGYLNQATYNLVATSAFGFDPSAWRWLSLVATALKYRSAIRDCLAAMSQTTTPPKPQNLPPQSVATPETSQTSFPAKIITWMQAICRGEGANPALHNRGNLKYSTLTASWGATQGPAAKDGGHLAQFRNDQAGDDALCHFLVLGCQDELVAFHAPEARTLAGFTKVYAGNPPKGYIDAIVQAMGGDPNVQISTFLS